MLCKVKHIAFGCCEHTNYQGTKQLGKNKNQKGDDYDTPDGNFKNISKLGVILFSVIIANNWCSAAGKAHKYRGH